MPGATEQIRQPPRAPKPLSDGTSNPNLTELCAHRYSLLGRKGARYRAAGQERNIDSASAWCGHRGQVDTRNAPPTDAGEPAATSASVIRRHGGGCRIGEGPDFADLRQFPSSTALNAQWSRQQEGGTLKLLAAQMTVNETMQSGSCTNLFHRDPDKPPRSCASPPDHSAWPT